MQQSIPKKVEEGLPAWVMTFADLMSLLLAFFVLLFSFSELDKQKFKELSGSMKDAFGVQDEVQVRDAPKGISLIAREFSPGRPTPTPLNVVRQETTNDKQRMMDVGRKMGGDKQDADRADALRKFQAGLETEIDDGLVEVESEGSQIVVRIREKGSFASGTADLEPSVVPIIEHIGALISNLPGQVNVVGHTDSVPISTPRFRSNWELASARAVSVLHYLMDATRLPAQRFHVEGYGDTRPVASNDTSEGRALNRRVEVILSSAPS